MRVLLQSLPPGVQHRDCADLCPEVTDHTQIEHLRVSIAKHEVSRHAKRTPAYAPGYGRLSMWCGSLEYELSTDYGVFGKISRRDIADTIRTFGDTGDTPSDDDIAEFDRMIKEMHRAPDLSTLRPPERP